MKSPAREATSQVPVGLMAPAGDSVLTPLGDTGCAAANVVATARAPIALSMGLNMSALLSGCRYTQGRAAFAFSSKLAILSFFTRVSPMSSRPFSRQCLLRIDFEPDHAAVGTAYLLL